MRLYTFSLISYFNSSFSNHSLLTCLAVFDCPTLEECYQGHIQAALKFVLTIDNFDDLVDPRHLYKFCLRPPFAFVLKKIAREKKSMFDLSFLFISLFFVRVEFSNPPILQKWPLGIARISMLM